MFSALLYGDVLSVVVDETGFTPGELGWRAAAVTFPPLPSLKKKLVDYIILFGTSSDLNNHIVQRIIKAQTYNM